MLIKAIPTVIGVGVAWIAYKLHRNELLLEKRRQELQIQLNRKMYVQGHYLSIGNVK